MAYTFGQGGSAVVGTGDTVTVCLKEWSATYDYGVQDLTTTCSTGYRDLGTGIKSLEVTMSGFYDPAEGTLFLLNTSNELAIEFKLGTSTSSYSGTFLVKTFKVTNPATEYVTFEATFGSTGEITVTEL